MKIVRSNVFETNSSSAHSLVLSKESKTYEDKYDWFRGIFGSTYEDIWDHFNYDWDEEGNKLYKKDKNYEFNFCRGEVRIYDDPLHKMAFLFAYYRYKDNKELLDHLIDYSSKMIKKYLDEYDDKYDTELIRQLTEFYIDGKFIRKHPGKWQSDCYITSEFSGTSNLIEKIIHSDDLLEKFLFNSNSYISISGDEYESAYLRLVGSEEEYYKYYNYKLSESEKAFSKRVDEVYPEDKYEVDYHI